MSLLFSLLDKLIGNNVTTDSYNDGNYDDDTFDEECEFDQDRWGNLIDRINSLVDDCQFERAESMLGNYYRQYEPEKDFYYYQNRAYILIRWIQSQPYRYLSKRQCDNIFKRAIESIRQAQVLSTDDEDKSQLGEWRMIWTDCKNQCKSYYDFSDKINDYYSKHEFSKALSCLDHYYHKWSIEYDRWYYCMKTVCICDMYASISYNDEDEPQLREQLNSLLEELRELCDDDEDVETFAVINSQVQKEMATKDLSRYTDKGQYDSALDVVEAYFVANPQDVINYKSLKRLVLQRKWRATSVTDANFQRIEQDVIDAYKDWENCCTTDEEKESCRECYDNAFLSIKKEKEEELKASCLNHSETNKPCVQSCDENEAQYKNEVLLILQDGEIDSVARKLLERKRQKFGLSQEQAQMIEESCTNVWTVQEQEYLELYKDLVEDGNPSDRVRKMLNREAEALGLTPDQVKNIEESIK